MTSNIFSLIFSISTIFKFGLTEYYLAIFILSILPYFLKILIIFFLTLLDFCYNFKKEVHILFALAMETNSILLSMSLFIIILLPAKWFIPVVNILTVAWLFAKNYAPSWYSLKVRLQHYILYVFFFSSVFTRIYSLFIFSDLLLLFIYSPLLSSTNCQKWSISSLNFPQ